MIVLPRLCRQPIATRQKQVAHTTCIDETATWQCQRCKGVRAYLPYMGDLTDRIRDILRDYNVYTVFKRSRKGALSRLWTPKRVSQQPPTWERVGGVYYIPCEDCGLGYFGESWNLACRCKQHKAAKRNGTLAFAPVRHQLTEGHRVEPDRFRVIAIEGNWRIRKIKEAFRIRMFPNFNPRAEAMQVARSWRLLDPPPQLRVPEITSHS